MFRTRIVCLIGAAACLLGLTAAVSALEVDSDSVHCFRPGDFSEKENLSGICITGLPDPAAGTVMLGNRVLQPGDILAVSQLAQMTFSPLQTENDCLAQVTYLPIYPDRVEKAAVMTISIRGKVNQPPVAQDQFLETYKNLPNEGKLKVSDPEGKGLVYTLIRQPRRGTVELKEDGTFLYTPKKNKVGVDSFVFTAADPAGNVSREATVTVRILKPTDAPQYSDTAESSCRFEAEWLKNSGLFTGEQIGSQLCFQENRPLSRGEFLAMALKVLEIPMDEEAEFTGYAEDIPLWLRPYLAAAMRAGLTAGLPASESGSFEADRAVTGAEAAVMLQSGLDLAVETTAPQEESVPAWAAQALSAMAQIGMPMEAEQPLTRGQAARLLYRISRIVPEAPGLQMFR